MKRFIALCLALCCSFAVATPAGIHDGAWWNSVSVQHRTGFLAGYIDCALNDAGEKQYEAVAWNVAEQAVTKRYSAHAAELKTPVSSMLVQFVKEQKPGPIQPGGEVYPGKHGIFDGEYWRQSPPEHRLGFIEGYLERHAKIANSGVSYAQPAAFYVKQISNWYGIRADDPGEINAKRSPRKIADVLYLFREKAGTPAGK
jgi:hypothetical protein